MGTAVSVFGATLVPQATLAADIFKDEALFNQPDERNEQILALSQVDLSKQGKQFYKNLISGLGELFNVSKAPLNKNCKKSIDAEFNEIIFSVAKADKARAWQQVPSESLINLFNRTFRGHKNIPMYHGSVCGVKEKIFLLDKNTRSGFLHVNIATESGAKLTIQQNRKDKFYIRFKPSFSNYARSGNFTRAELKKLRF